MVPAFRLSRGEAASTLMRSTGRTESISASPVASAVDSSETPLRAAPASLSSLIHLARRSALVTMNLMPEMALLASMKHVYASRSSGLGKF